MKKKKKERNNEKSEETKKNVEKKIVNEDVSNKYGKQTKIAVVLMVVLLASIFFANWLIQESKKFNYNDMKFYEEKEGSILFYKSLLGYVTQQGENIPFILKLRNDPRELKKILIEGEIKNLKKEVVLSLSPEIADCPDTVRTMTDFSITLKAFGILASAATIDKNYSKEYNAPLVSCKNSGQKTVIVMEEGNETKITKYEDENKVKIVSGKESVIIDEKDCYTIKIKNCEIQQSFERFILEFISNSMKV